MCLCGSLARAFAFLLSFPRLMSAHVKLFSIWMCFVYGFTVKVRMLPVLHVHWPSPIWGPAFCLEPLGKTRKNEGRTFSKIPHISAKLWVFWAEHPRKVLGFFRRSFCAGRELRRPKSDHVHPAFSWLFPFLTAPTSHENPRFPFPLQIKDSWDHAQIIEREILFRIALTRALYDQVRP